MSKASIRTVGAAGLAAVTLAVGACGGAGTPAAGSTRRAAALTAAVTHYKVGFANETLAASFNVDVQNSMTAAARSAGDRLVVLNNNSSDTTALQNAQIFVNDKVNAVVEFQQDAKIGGAIAQIYKKAGIKTLISIDIPQPNAIFFGASNYADGLLTGQRLGSYAKSHSWNAAKTYLISIDLPAAGAIPQLRMTGMAQGIAASFPGLPAKNVFHENGQGDTADSQSATASLLPRIPSGDHVIIVGINDESTLGGLRAAQVAGRSSGVIEGSQGGDAIGIQQIKTNSSWIGDTEYFPEYYGKYIFQVLSSVKGGKKVQPYAFMPRVFLNKADVDTYYPGSATTAVKPPTGGIQFSSTPKSS